MKLIIHAHLRLIIILDEINETELKNLEKRDDGKFEILDVKLDNRKTKNLDPKTIIKLLIKN